MRELARENMSGLLRLGLTAAAADVMRWYPVYTARLI